MRRSFPLTKTIIFLFNLTKQHADFMLFFMNKHFYRKKLIIIKPYLYFARLTSELCQPACILYFDIFYNHCVHIVLILAFVLDIISNTFLCICITHTGISLHLFHSEQGYPFGKWHGHGFYLFVQILFILGIVILLLAVFSSYFPIILGSFLFGL